VTLIATCPTCGQIWPSARGKRMCSGCRKQIRRHDKWYFGADGRPRHKDCEHPEGTLGMRTETMELL